MRVLTVGTYDPAFARNKRLHALLRAAGHEVDVCQVDLWGADRVDIPNQGKLAMLGRAITAYPKLTWKFLRAPKPDVALVLYPGWFDVVFVSLLAKLRRVPVVFDIFISLFDTVVSDRKLVAPTSPIAWLCKTADRVSMRLATRVIADTPVHADFFSQLSGVARDRFGVVWLGAQDDVFVPAPEIAPIANRVLFHGTFIGLQGIDTIIRAVKLLDEDDLDVRVVGSGQEQPMVDRLVEELQPKRLTLVGRVPLEQVRTEIAAAGVCLGIFGASGKAGNVVPNKLYECLAMGRPVITGDTPAIRAAFTHDEVVVVPVADPAALAGAIRALVADRARRESIAAAGHAKYVATYSEAPLSALLTAELTRARTHP